MAPPGFDMVSGLGPLHTWAVSQHGPSGPWAHRVVGLKTMVSTMPPLSLVEISCFFNWGKYCVLKLGCGKLKGLGKSMRTLNMAEGGACLDTKSVGSARFPIRLRCMMF